MPIISTSDAKAWLRVSGADEDDKISDLIAAFEAYVQNEYGIFCSPGEARWTFDRFAPLMVLPTVPVQQESVVVTYLDGDGELQTVADCRVVAIGKYCRILPPAGDCWPMTGCEEDAVTVTGAVGWEDGEVPADIKVAAKFALLRWYDDEDAELPKGARDLLEPYRPRRV